jgi:hypothetical protein
VKRIHADERSAEAGCDLDQLAQVGKVADAPVPL